MRHKVQLCFLGIIIVGALFVYLYPLTQGIFHFTFDSARDLLWVKNQVDFKYLSLIGPWASLTGVFFGPLWFWLLLIPYLVGRGDPTVAVLFNGLVVYSAVIVLAYGCRRYSSKAAYFILVTGFMSQALRSLAGYAFAQHLLPLLTVLLVMLAARFVSSRKPLFYYLSALCIGLMFHAEPPVAVFSTPLLVILPFINRDKKRFITPKVLILTGLFFVIPFLPSILFDLRHELLQLKAVGAYLHGQNKSLADILPFPQRLLERPAILFSVFKNTIFSISKIGAGLLLIAAITAILKAHLPKPLQIMTKVSLIYFLIVWMLFTLYPPQFKEFYTDGLSMIFVFWVAYLWTAVYESGHGRKWLYILLIILFVANTQPGKFIDEVNSGFAQIKTNGSIYANQRAIVDWIYQDAGGVAFSVYTYDPAVYDFPFQYLFFTYGQAKYGYLPADFAYLPNQPEYVQRKTAQLLKLKSQIKMPSQKLYLIILADKYSANQTSWLANFPLDRYPLITTETFPDKTVVQLRSLLKLQ